MLATRSATRYVTPLREGGSLPGLMEADDLGTYVVKFTGAGQGPRALVAEVISAALARALALPVPELAVIDVDPALAAGEPDEEVQELLRASPGPNLGVDFLPGALDLDPEAFEVSAELAGRVLWFDALIGNVDRSWRNPNLLFWHGRCYLIDHGAALTFHHNWPGAAGAASKPYDPREHALLGCAPDVAAADAALAPLLLPPVLTAAVADIPDAWLLPDPLAGDAEAQRARYVEHLEQRLAARPQWVAPLVEAVAAFDASAPRTARRNRPHWLEAR